jgi:hypothetical protein
VFWGEGIGYVFWVWRWFGFRLWSGNRGVGSLGSVVGFEFSLEGFLENLDRDLISTWRVVWFLVFGLG